jgi:hypothetical protein
VRVTTGKVAEALGQSRRTIQRWMKRDGYPVDEAGLADVEEVRAWAEREGLLGRAQEDGRPTAVDRLGSGEPPPVLRLVPPAAAGPAPGARGGDEDGAAAVPVPPAARARGGDRLADLGDDERAALATLVDGNPEALINLAATIDLGLLKRLAAMGKTRRELAEAERREMDNRRVRGDLVLLDDVRRWWGGHVTAAKAVLQALPGKLAPSLSGRPVEYDEAYTTIEREVEASLHSLSRAVFGG